MKHVALIVTLMLATHPLSTGAPACILNIDEVPPKGVTQVWSPLFQASWDKLSEMQRGKLEKVVPPNVLIAKLEEFKLQSAEVMPKDGFAVYAGQANQVFARETAASIKRQFNIEIDSSRVPTIPQGVPAYGILLRELKFEKKFFRSQKTALEFRSRTGQVRRVEFFGTAGSHSDNYGEHVKVLHYKPETSAFILSVATDRNDENLIIYRPDEECSFRNAFEHVKKAVKEPLSGAYGSLTHGSLHRNDVVKIPYVTIDADTDFKGQLSGALHYTGEALPWLVAGAFQVTRFELFEEGARVRVDTGVGTEPFGEPPKPPPVTPRSFVCEKPFFVFLWRAGADWPYLATWIDGGECLTPFPK